MDAADLELRNLTYRLFVERGRAPSVDEVARDAGASSAAVRAAWRRLHDAHALVLDADGAIRMANPFSAVTTPYLVHAAGRTWHGNCAWDAFGICAALGSDGHISAPCADCGEPIEIDVRDGEAVPGDDLFHVLVPAEQWVDDIRYT